MVEQTLKTMPCDKCDDCFCILARLPPINNKYWREKVLYYCKRNNVVVYLVSNLAGELFALKAYVKT